jgi:RHS repeat-associated protein
MSIPSQDNSHRPDHLQLVFFTGEGMGMGIPIPSNVIELYYDSEDYQWTDSLQATFTATSSELYVMIVADKAGEDPMHLYIDNYALRQNWVSTLNCDPSNPNNTFAEERRYRFGFNGMERDDELKGAGNSLDFGARIYDSRLGKWMSPDPWERSYPGFSTYSGFLNNPVFIIDPTGKGGKSSLVNINGQQTILVSSTLIVYTNNEDVRANIHNIARQIESEIEGYFNIGATSSWDNSGNYPILFNVTVQVYEAGGKIIHRPDVNYVELVDEPGGRDGIADPWNTQMNVSNTRNRGNYAHEFGHLLGFGKMFLNELENPSAGVTFNDHGQNSSYDSDGKIEGFRRFDVDIRNSRMVRNNFGMNQAVLGQLNFGLGVGRPLEFLNLSVVDVDGESYNQYMIQSWIKSTSSFFFGQQDTTTEDSLPTAP